MINRKELRVGSYVWFECTLHQITTIGLNKSKSQWVRGETPALYSHTYEELEPVEINKILLNCLGFKYEDREEYPGYFCPYGYEKALRIWINGKGDFIFSLNDYSHITLKYVHELQQLYYVITKEELVINVNKYRERD